MKNSKITLGKHSFIQGIHVKVTVYITHSWKTSFAYLRELLYLRES
jgi:hypothetical protein